MILASTKTGISLSISNFCKQSPFESKDDAVIRFKKRVFDAQKEERLKVINENSKYRFVRITDKKFECKDSFGNIMFLYVNC